MLPLEVEKMMATIAKDGAAKTRTTAPASREFASPSVLESRPRSEGFRKVVDTEAEETSSSSGGASAASSDGKSEQGEDDEVDPSAAAVVEEVDGSKKKRKKSAKGRR